LHRRLKELPAVLSVSSPAGLESQFQRQSGSMMAIFTFIITAFASVIAVGVIYNNARVALSSRSRDLATLRVLGYTRAEVAGLLYAELAIQVALAIPVGLLLGNWMAHGLLSATDPETYRFPVVISPKSYAFATAVTIASAVFSVLLVRRRIDRLDLMGVLKTRE
jgi:putative ABC transport system permease protein